LEKLRERFEQGPIDWANVLGGQENEPELPQEGRGHAA
jgi:hypothetical protein